MDTDREEVENSPLKRGRRVTDIALQWLAQRLRKSEEIKRQVSSGSYSVDSSKVAASIINEE